MGMEMAELAKAFAFIIVPFLLSCYLYLVWNIFAFISSMVPRFDFITWRSVVTTILGVVALMWWWGRREQQKAVQAMQRRIEENKAREKRMTLPSREDWTIEEVKAYDGSDSEKPILIVVEEKVYNVWRGWEWYGPYGAYHVFAGRDATRLLAKYILKDAEDDGKPFTDEEKKMLLAWHAHFGGKYGCVGTLASGKGEKEEDKEKTAPEVPDSKSAQTTKESSVVSF